jgi:hypothetical protein
VAAPTPQTFKDNSVALIDLDELKSVLGVGDIYPDAELQEVADAAQNIILSYLVFNDSAIIATELTSNVATFHTLGKHNFVVGSALTITGCGTTFNGSRTVTEKSNFSFKAAITHADEIYTPIKPVGQAVLTAQATLYDATPEIRLAALITAEDLWLTRMGTVGQQGVDFQPAPYRLSRGAITRISVLLVKHLDTGALVG